MYELIALGYRSSLALCLTKVRSSRACCPATALIYCSNAWATKVDLAVKYVKVIPGS